LAPDGPWFDDQMLYTAAAMVATLNAIVLGTVLQRRAYSHGVA